MHSFSRTTRLTRFLPIPTNWQEPKPDHRRSLSQAILTVTLLTLAFACDSSDKPETQVLVTIDAEAGVRSRAARLDVLIEGGDEFSDNLVTGRTTRHTHTFVPSDLPVRVLLKPENGDDGRVYGVTATALDTAGSEIAKATLISGYVAGEERYAHLTVEDACADQSCPSGDTCEQGRCVDAQTDPDLLDAEQQDSGVPEGTGGVTNTGGMLATGGQQATGGVDDTGGDDTHDGDPCPAGFVGDAAPNCRPTITNLTATLSELTPAWDSSRDEYTLELGSESNAITLEADAPAGCTITTGSTSVEPNESWLFFVADARAPSLVLTVSHPDYSGTTRYTLNLDLVPPQWAHSAGIDAHGVWAEFAIVDLDIKMRRIPFGTFLMGAPDDEVGQSATASEISNSVNGERPQHEVVLTQSFWLAETETTQAVWQTVLGSIPAANNGEPNDPVAHVSWELVAGFLKSLNSQYNLQARLPTEAEWEYAARAGSTTARYGTLNAIAWYASNSGDLAAEVGLKSPNDFGLYDMLGNLYEWCSDYYRAYPSTRQTDPDVQVDSGLRIRRGGSFDRDANFQRAAHRSALLPTAAGDSIGFRIAHP